MLFKFAEEACKLRYKHLKNGFFFSRGAYLRLPRKKNHNKEAQLVEQWSTNRGTKVRFLYDVLILLFLQTFLKVTRE